MAQYHVGCGPISGAIYAGTLNKKGDMWLNKTDVTEEALASVRDHLEYQAQKEKQSTFGYEWTKKNGTVVQLLIKILSPQEETNDVSNS